MFLAYHAELRLFQSVELNQFMKFGLEYASNEIYIFDRLQIRLKMFRLPASLLHLNDVQNFARFLNGCGLFFVEIISKICFMK